MCALNFVLPIGLESPDLVCASRSIISRQQVWLTIQYATQLLAAYHVLVSRVNAQLKIDMCCKSTARDFDLED